MMDLPHVHAPEVPAGIKSALPIILLVGGGGIGLLMLLRAQASAGAAAAPAQSFGGSGSDTSGSTSAATTAPDPVAQQEALQTFGLGILQQTNDINFKAAQQNETLREQGATFDTGQSESLAAFQDNLTQNEQILQERLSEAANQAAFNLSELGKNNDIQRQYAQQPLNDLSTLQKAWQDAKAAADAAKQAIPAYHSARVGLKVKNNKGAIKDATDKYNQLQQVADAAYAAYQSALTQVKAIGTGLPVVGSGLVTAGTGVTAITGSNGRATIPQSAFHYGRETITRRKAAAV